MKYFWRILLLTPVLLIGIYVFCAIFVKILFRYIQDIVFTFEKYMFSFFDWCEGKFEL